MRLASETILSGRHVRVKPLRFQRKHYARVLKLYECESFSHAAKSTMRQRARREFLLRSRSDGRVISESRSCPTARQVSAPHKRGRDTRGASQQKCKSRNASDSFAQRPQGKL